MSSRLKKLVSSAKYFIIRCLRADGVTQRSQLEPYVISGINRIEKRDGTVKHVTKPIHYLAFILAYKELENEHQIKITRKGIPFPMTDNETIFALRSEGSS